MTILFQCALRVFEIVSNYFLSEGKPVLIGLRFLLDDFLDWIKNSDPSYNEVETKQIFSYVIF